MIPTTGVGQSRSVVLALAALLASGAAGAQEAPRDARVDSLFSQWDRPDSPGCALGVLRDHSLVYARGYGTANLETGEPITPKTVFYLASVSKQFTAASAALLTLEGALSLDDDARRYIPELPDYGPTITVRDLIHHTSGLRDYLTLMSLADMSLEEPHTPSEILDLIARQEALNFNPGERYLYSNTGYFLIPLIVERVSGRSFREFTAERIFNKLGMRNTHFHDDYRHRVPGRALSYRRDDDGAIELSFLPKFDQVGSGGVLSNVEDLALWDENYYSREVGGTGLFELQHVRGVLASGDTIDYALGLSLGTYKGLETVSHGGSMMGFRTHLLRFPEERFTVICLCNLGDIDPGRLARAVADIHLEETFDETLAEYAGEYEARELEVTWRLRVARGELLLDGPADSTVTLSSAGKDRFRAPNGALLEFLRGDGDGIQSFTLDAGRARGIIFRRQ